MLKNIFLGGLASIFLIGQPLARANPINWQEYPDFQLDSLPSPDGEFELRGLKIGEDNDYYYFAVYSSQALVAGGASYKDAKVFLGDLLLDFSPQNDYLTNPETNYTVRLSANNRSNLPIGTIGSGITLKSVSSQVYGHETLTSYTRFVRRNGYEPYYGNTPNYFPEYPLQVTDTYRSLAEGVTYPTNYSDLGLTEQPSVLVKVPKSLLPEGEFISSIALECNNDFLSALYNPLGSTPIETGSNEVVEIEVSEVEGIELTEPILELSDAGFPVEYFASAVGVSLLLLLLGGSDDNTIALNPSTPSNPSNPSNPPQNIPPSIPNQDVRESRISWIFYTLFALLLLYARKRI